MAEHSNIEWTDHTFNPWTGCTKVSPGCDGCYAEAWSKRSGAVQWGPHAERRRTTPGNWRKPLIWQKHHGLFEAQHGRRQRVFCASLADVFDNQVPQEWRDDLFHLIEATPALDWLLLTKRIGNVQHMAWPRWMQVGLPKNVWLGATAVSQAEVERDVHQLQAVPAAVHFLSIEPMLGPIDLERPRPGPDMDQGGGQMICQPWLIQSGIDWVIAGGESGPGARPMHPSWVRSLRDQCANAGVPFLFKQWGEWTPGENVERTRGTVDTALLWEDGWRIHPLNLATDHGHVDDQPDLYRVGKKSAGRHLDGRIHDDFPCTSRPSCCSNAGGKRPADGGSA